MSRKERKRLGSIGTQFCKDNQMTAEEMGANFIKSMNGVFENWKPKERYTMVKV